MGSVSVDIHKKEREYNNLTLSDENVVRYLILYRSSVDVGYGANTNININQAGDMFEFNQELICLYSSLDVILSKIELKEREKILLDLIFEGNTISDIVKNFGYAKMTAHRIFNKIVDKIVKENFIEWKKVMEKKDYIIRETS